MYLNYFCIWFLLFILYSNLGWVMEVVGKLIEKKKFINRGFLIGPICPIYGWGSIFIVFFLDKFKYDSIVLFCMAIFICSLLEYFTSYFMEKIFHTRWWDYSTKKFNLNGRICLETMIPFGLLGLIIVYLLNPFFLSIISKFSSSVIVILSFVFFFVFIIDNIVSFDVIFKFRNTIRNIEKDATEEITKKVRDIFLSKSIIYRRLVEAFPNFKSPYEYLTDIQRSINDKINSIKGIK